VRKAADFFATGPQFAQNRLRELGTEFLKARRVTDDSRLAHGGLNIFARRVLK
jgi:hypothetical protein